MPMPPPKPSAEARSDPRVRGEAGQLVRALRANGPIPVERLAELVGADYWDRGRFDAALALAMTEGLLLRDHTGKLTVP